MTLKTGLISQESYKENLGTSTFLELEKFNDEFLVRNKHELAEYHGKWTNDSFHTWSRQYEYPFFYESVVDYINKNPGKEVRILDAGSGLTFFPYLLSEKFPNVVVTCTDYDSILNSGFEKINKNQKGKVKFIQSDLRQRVFEPGSFDFIYCVSVLEHTSEFKQIIENFHTYLSEIGEFVLSFDISVDGDRDIPVAGANKLIKELNYLFTPLTQDKLPSEDDIRSGDFLTTKFINVFNKKLSPWRSPYKNFLWCLKNFKRPKFYFNLALYCQRYKKK